MSTDPIADLLTRIRNAQLAGHESVELSYSKLKEQIVRILKEEGFVAGWKVNQKEPSSTITIALKYGPGRQPVIRHLARVSKPGRRIYTGKDEVPIILGGMGVSIVSTSRGVMTGKKAKQLGVGGEVLCEVY